MLEADYVIELVSKPRVLFVDEAIFTSAAGALGHAQPQFWT